MIWTRSAEFLNLFLKNLNSFFIVKFETEDFKQNSLSTRTDKD